MKKLIYGIMLLIICLGGCNSAPPPKIGISFGVGEAKRWPQELAYMEERAKALGMHVESRLNKTDTPKTQTQDCIELIDSGISVLILTPRDARKTEEILAYAKKKKVKVISYARAVLGENIDLFIGYDIYKIGQTLGRHLSEKAHKGNIAILKGDQHDFNSPMMYDGAMKYIGPLVEQGDVNVILDIYVKAWSVEYAKSKLREALAAHENKIDAIFAHNDILAGAAASVLEERGITSNVVITGMDAELAALQRIAKGKQDATIFMDLKAMAYAAVNEAHNLATAQKTNVNSLFDNESTLKIDAYLINGKVVTKENMDKVIIAPGYYSREEVYGSG